MCVILVLLVASIVATAAVVDEQCPPWFVVDSNTSQCICSRYLPHMIVCDQSNRISYLRLGYCAFCIHDSNDTVVAACPYIFPKRLFENSKLLQPLPKSRHSLNSIICSSLHREVRGSMCGRCTNGTGPSVTSMASQCVKCGAINVLYYILLQYLPATITFLVILLFRINVTSAPMAYYVLFCNALVVFFQLHESLFITQSVPDVPYSYILKAFLTLNSIWSFDLLYFVSPPLCLSPHIEEINIYYIHMLATLYPFLLLLLAYVGVKLHARDCQLAVILWRPLHKLFARFRRSCNYDTSLVQAFVTVFFISYSKLLFVVFRAFSRADFIDEYGTVITQVTYIDPTVPMYSPRHIYLMIFSTCVLLFIVLPPILVLIVFPTRLSNKLQTYFSPRLNLALFTFVGTFQSCYKDGTNGTRDYRALSGGILGGCVLILAIEVCSHFFIEVNDRNPVISWQIVIILLIVLLVSYAVLRPYKSEVANQSSIVILALLTVCCTLYLTIDTTIFKINVSIFVFIALLSLPHCVFYGYVVYRLQQVWSNGNFKAAMRSWCCQQLREAQPLVSTF